MIPTGGPVASLAGYEGGLALTTGASPASHLGGTLRVVADDNLDSLDPGRGWSSTGWAVLSLTNDGLVTYARMPGPGGATIVPDLAVALPVAQDGGRTYTFQLRRGLRYSTGAPIRPGDFRATFERQYRAETGLAAFRVPIRGAGGCSRSRCDLSSGIVVDDAARTITFRLSEPDPDFLYKLALPFGSVVPAGSPRSAPARAHCLRPARTGSCAMCRVARWCSRAIRTSARGRRRRSPAGFPTASRCGSASIPRARPTRSQPGMPT